MKITWFCRMGIAGVGLIAVASSFAAPPSDGVVIPALPHDSAPVDATDAKLHAQLRSVLDARARGADALARLPDALHRDDQVLVEVTLSADEDISDALDLLARHGATVRNTLTAARHEVWISVDRLRELAQEAAVVRVTLARLVQFLNTVSAGVASSNADYWQTFNPSYTGTGITIALIDGYDNSRISSLQSSGDWPPTARLSCFDLKNTATNPPYTPVSCGAGTFGNEVVQHGDATMELAYDVAPGATYRAYDTATIGDWRNAIIDAAGGRLSGSTIVNNGAVKANVISASLAAYNDGVGDGSAQPGSVAEAAAFAFGRGVLVVNAAGNERQNHWGGNYAPSSSPTMHTWSGANTQYNFFTTTTGSGTPACIPAGTTITTTSICTKTSAQIPRRPGRVLRSPTICNPDLAPGLRKRSSPSSPPICRRRAVAQAVRRNTR